MYLHKLYFNLSVFFKDKIMILRKLFFINILVFNSVNISQYVLADTFITKIGAQDVECHPGSRLPQCLDQEVKHWAEEGCNPDSLKPECNRSSNEDVICQNLVDTGDFSARQYSSSERLNQINCMYVLLCVKYHPELMKNFYGRDIISRCPDFNIDSNKIYREWKLHNNR